ncbi:MAG: AbrB/MazE/SpoVT family DNA-binding domain-containing protein [Verrucomicrobiales bacterium]|nr:AbrB/MazE/SpoVT family DNA-binding domain-containing protein [Verrucomicrobiales bacterium]
MNTILPISKRGTITLPPSIRRKYGLDSMDGSLLILEERENELILTPAAAVPLRDIPEKKLKEWLRKDEEEMQTFLLEKKKKSQRK